MPHMNGLPPDLAAFLDASPCAREIVNVFAALRGPCRRSELLLILCPDFSADAIDEALDRLEGLGVMRQIEPRRPLPIRFCLCHCPRCGPLAWRC